MNTSNQSYKELAIPFFKEVFDHVDEVMISHNIPYYLIGASAIALELLKKGNKPNRGTKDIDFAIMISSIHEYDDLTKSFEAKGFNKVKAPWTFYSPTYNVAVDILPFGEIEEHDTEQFHQRYSDLHVLGMKEVLEEPEVVQIENRFVNIPPLPGMILLKLVAWSDRPEERENDLVDILLIIKYYFEFNYDEILDHYYDTFPAEGFDPLIIAAEVLGRKAAQFLKKSDELAERIYMVLDQNIDNEKESDIAKEWARTNDWEIAYAIKILKAFQNGILK
ncbi:hypothetical protein [Fulvivirga ligni]|uniref:hypothetical protein n=1 Tax=Fulvivirga ligni TaxID=2904246 RepID=UPI001F297F21|nr:hypothetical protein [Fulvivirga ligni]UII21568.1 hypothetical protein LVD16_27450 [Fulvivirga ligni]UII21622.1 hypothetical protein LVD16_00015 [Fulvivirga ligni]